MINSSEGSDILVFNCYLCHVRFLLTCYVCSTKIGEISDISKCFENFVSQALGVLTRIYAAELRKQINYGEKFVIGLVHHTAEGHIGDGFPNHYIQMTGMDNSNYVHYWTWGESTTRKSHVFGNIHGIYQIYLIDR